MGGRETRLGDEDALVVIGGDHAGQRATLLLRDATEGGDDGGTELPGLHDYRSTSPFGVRRIAVGQLYCEVSCASRAVRTASTGRASMKVAQNG